MTLYIISQILVALAIVTDMIGKCMKSKTHLMLFMAISCVFCVASYICLGSTLAAIANGLFLIRGIWYLQLEKHNANIKNYILPICLIALLFVIALIILWTDASNLLILASMLILTITLAFKNLLVIRIMLIVNSLLWILFNLTLNAYVNIIFDAITIGILLVTIYFYEIVPRRKLV